jgi:hypothetical protein
MHHFCVHTHTHLDASPPPTVSIDMLPPPPWVDRIEILNAGPVLSLDAVLWRLVALEACVVVYLTVEKLKHWCEPKSLPPAEDVEARDGDDEDAIYVTQRDAPNTFVWVTLVLVDNLLTGLFEPLVELTDSYRTLVHRPRVAPLLLEHRQPLD